MFLIALLYALLALTFPIGKILLATMTPIALVGVRMTLGGLILLFIQKMRGQSIHLHHRDWGKIAQTSIALIYLSYAFEFWAMARMPSFKTCMFFAIGPFITYILGCSFFGEKLRLRKVIGLCIGFCGMLPMLATTEKFEDMVRTLLVFGWPELAMIGSVLSYCYGWFIVRDLTVGSGYAPFTITGWSMILGGSLAILSSLLAGVGIPLVQPLSFWMLLLLIIFIGNIAAYNLYAWLLKKYSATFLSLASVLEQFFGALFGWLLLGEHISWTFFLAMGIVMIGLYTFYSAELKDHTPIS